MKEALETFAGEQGDAVEHLGVARGQRVEDEAGQLRRIGGALVEGFEAAFDALGVDALRHALGQQQVGVVDVENAFGAGDLFRGGAEGCNLPFLSAQGPLVDALADEPHAVNVLWKQMRSPTAPRLVKLSACAAVLLRACSISVPTRDQVPEEM